MTKQNVNKDMIEVPFNFASANLLDKNIKP